MLVLSVLLCFCVLIANIHDINAVPKSDSEVKLFKSIYNFDVDATVLFNDVNRTDKEIGYKIKATLGVTPAWSNDDNEFLLKFDFRNPKLHLRGKHPTAEFLPHPSPLDSYSESPFYALWNKGVVETLYLDSKEMKDIYNLKKALASLFQFQIIDGEYKEKDISGECDVLYESISEHVFRKMKRHCSWETPDIHCRRVTRYTLQPTFDGIDSIYSDEVVSVGDTYGVKVRSFLTLKATGSEDVEALGGELDAVLQGLPAGVKPVGLPMVLTADNEVEYKSLSEAIDANIDGLDLDEPGAGGSDDSVQATIRLLPALRTATTDQLKAVLKDEKYSHLLSGLTQLIGAAGTLPGLEAVEGLVHMRSGDPVLPLAHSYLQGLALSDQPQEAAILAILKIGEKGKNPSVSESALLSAAAAAHTLASGGDDKLSAAVKDTLSKLLAKCKDDDCKTVRIQAISNLRRADTVELLLQHAENKQASAPARVAALDGLAALPLAHDKLHRLTHVATHAAAPLEVRASALDLVICRHVHVPLPLVRIMSRLDKSPPELRRVFWQRFRALAETHESIRDLYKRLAVRLKSWDALAINGTSSVLVRNTGWRVGEWSSKLESVQLAQGGLLKRGVVRLTASTDDGPDIEGLAVEVWTRGLEALAGGSTEEAKEDEGDAEGAAGGLAVRVGGVRMRGITLFEGQAALLGHIWSGAASSPTRVVRAVRPLRAWRGRLPLSAGLMVTAAHDTALSYAIDASIQISLWWRTARSDLTLRASVGSRAALGARPAWGVLRGVAVSGAAPSARIASDLDFYTDIALCVRTTTDPYELRRNVTLSSDQGTNHLRLTRSHDTSVRFPGRTVALGRPNDVTCRTLKAAENEQ